GRRWPRTESQRCDCAPCAWNQCSGQQKSASTLDHCPSVPENPRSRRRWRHILRGAGKGISARLAICSPARRLWLRRPTVRLPSICWLLFSLGAPCDLKLLTFTQHPERSDGALQTPTISEHAKQCFLPVLKTTQSVRAHPQLPIQFSALITHTVLDNGAHLPALADV